MAIPVEDVKGIGPASALLLKEAGIGSASELAASGIDRIAAIKGFSETRAERVIENAKTLLGAETTPEVSAPAPPSETKPAKTAAGEKKKTDKKKKKKKGGKKKNDKKGSKKKKKGKKKAKKKK